MTSEIDDESLVKFIDTFRLTTESSAIIPVDGGDHRCVVDWEMLLSLGLLQLKPAAFETPAEDRLSFDEQTEEQTLRPYPSVRCLALFTPINSLFCCSCIPASSAMSLLQSVCSQKAEKVASCDAAVFLPFTFPAP